MKNTNKLNTKKYGTSKAFKSPIYSTAYLNHSSSSILWLWSSFLPSPSPLLRYGQKEQSKSFK
jgi:hypothetical protein